MSDPDLNLGIGGGQPPFGGGPSLEEDEKALKKGNTLMLVLGGVAALLVVVVLGVVLMSGDDAEPYEAIGRQVNGMKTEHFDGFWTCALPGLDLEDLRNDQDLRQEITKRAERRPSAYAQHVRERCLVKLDEHEPRLRQLIPPDESLGTQIESLTSSLNDLRTGWNGYVDALSRADGYDEGAMAPHVSKIAKGWYDYKHAHGEINSTVRTHLE